MDDTSEVTIAWAAGLIEGEGCFIIDRKNIAIVVAMTDKDIIDRLHSALGGYTYECTLPDIPNRKRIWRWKVHGRMAYSIIKQILPYLKERRTGRANQLLATFENSPTREVERTTQYRIRVISDGLNKGLKYREIAEQLGVDVSAVTHMIRKKNIPNKGFFYKRNARNDGV